MLIARYIENILMNFSKAFDLVPHSSNVNEVIRAVLNSFFFLRKDFALTKSTKRTKTQPSKRTKRYKRTKTKNALKKNPRGKKSLIRLFAFLCL